MTKNNYNSAVSLAQDYNILLDSREIFCVGDIEEQIAKNFIVNLSILSCSSRDPLIIHQFTGGGEWNSGIMMYDAIVHCPCPIIFICHGLASSMGSIIPLACIEHGNSYRISMPNCDWLIHSGNTGINTDLTHRQSKSWSNYESMAHRKMMDWYISACKTSKKFAKFSDLRIKNHIQKKMDETEDWIIDARTALEYGFIDGILGDEGFEDIDTIKSHWNT